MNLNFLTVFFPLACLDGEKFRLDEWQLPTTTTITHIHYQHLQYQLYIIMEKSAENLSLERLQVVKQPELCYNDLGNCELYFDLMEFYGSRTWTCCIKQ